VGKVIRRCAARRGACRGGGARGGVDDASMSSGDVGEVDGYGDSWFKSIGR
jgi:hypothetical protein